MESAKTKIRKTFAALIGATLLASLMACGQAPQMAGESRYRLNGIIGGKKASGEEDFARTIAGLYDERFGDVCTASILSDSLLITAAHCLRSPAKNLRVIFGTQIKAEDRITRDVVSYQTTPAWPDRKYQPKNSGDMALVSFSGGLPPGFKAATVLTDVSLLATDTPVLLAGYGVDDGVKRTGSGILRFVETVIADAAYSETEITVDQTGGKGACRGDSGGPAYVKSGDQWLLWGVTNGGVNDSKNDCSGLGLYASIPAYKSWIAETALKLTSSQNTAVND